MREPGTRVWGQVRYVESTWFALGFLEALECGRFGSDPSTTSSSAHWERTDDDMDGLAMCLRLPIRVLSASQKTHSAFPLRTATLGT